MKIAAVIAAITLLMSPLCGCTRDALPAVSSPGACASSSAPSLSEDERAALLTFYDSLPDQLTTRQRELLEAYRALRQYLGEQYPGSDWKVVLLEPAGPLNGGGNSYETFHLTLDGAEAKFQVQKDNSGAWQVINDSLSGRK